MKQKTILIEFMNTLNRLILYELTQKDWKDHSTISLTEAYSKPHISTSVLLLYIVIL